MGALTSKPYAFTARPWELKSVYSIDLLDGIATKIRLDIRGVNVMRVLPVVYNYINDEWITDKIRFSYDALSRQRLLFCIKKREDSYYRVSLKESFKDIFQHSFASDKKQINFTVGKTQDIETLFSAKLWAKRWFYSVNFFQDFLETPQSLHHYFLVKNNLFLSLKDLSKNEYILLLGTNLRYDLPMLNLKVKEQAKKNDLPVFIVGPHNIANYNLFSLGSNILHIDLLLKGKSLISSFFRKKQGLWLIDPRVNTFGPGFLEQMPQNYSFLFVHSFISFLNMYATNFVTQAKGFLDTTDSLLFNLNGDDHVLKNKKNSLYVYFGTFGDNASKIADYIFPVCHFFEKKFTTLNIEGIFSKADLGIVPAADVRSEISYFYALDKFFFFSAVKTRFLRDKNFFNNLQITGVWVKPILYKLFNRWLNLYNFYYGRVMAFKNKALFSTFSLTKKFVIKMPSKLLSRSVNNYFFTHAFTRASHFLAVANKRYSYNKLNF